MKVLIIDDDQALAMTWSIALEKAGFEVIKAITGQEGIDKAKSFMPDMILLDQIMPDRVGNEVLETLKSDTQTTAIPVLLISNYSESKMMSDAIQAGAVDYILKYQIETADLVAKVKGVLENKNDKNAPTTPPATSSS